jgi:hypothetical protein
MHIERNDAHQIDKTVRRLSDEHAEKAALSRLSWLEAYATAFRYTTPAGRIPETPDTDRLRSAIEAIELLIARVAAHFDVDLNNASEPARVLGPMRSSKGPIS